MKIMDMPLGTLIKNKRSGLTYILGEYVNDVARKLTLIGSVQIDYINKNTQDDYELVD